LSDLAHFHIMCLFYSLGKLDDEGSFKIIVKTECSVRTFVANKQTSFKGFRIFHDFMGVQKLKEIRKWPKNSMEPPQRSLK